VIDTREELINNLTEAAELEHGLLCQYLFAAFSMKKHPADGITWAQAERIRAWERNILEVAREEMAHLGTVSNMLTAIGGAPQFRRANFPQPARYFPVPSSTGVTHLEFSLQRFSLSTVERFVRFEAPDPELQAAFAAVAPDAPEYTTVGDLYRQIEAGFERLAGQNLFIGPQSAQDADTWTANLVIINVRDLETAKQAIQFIIEEGEGTPVGGEESHYAKFTKIRDELRVELAVSPGFDPSWPVAPNPLTRRHPDAAAGATIIGNEDAREVAELFNAVYGTVVLMLMQFYTFADDEPRHEALRATIRQAMSGVIRPLGEILVRMPIGETYPGLTAGAGFEFYTDLRIPHQTENSWTIFLERLVHEASECDRLSRKPEAPPRLAFLQENLEGLARNVERCIKLGEA
jgi:rubrerythrin